MIIISLPVILVGLFFAFERYLAKPWMRWGWWIVSVLMIGLVGRYVSRDIVDWVDFTYGYYYAGRIALTDLNQLYPTNSCFDGFVNFPLLAYLFLPFGLLPSQLAGQAFYIIGYISILPLAYWLIKLTELDGWKRWLMLVLLIVNDALDYSLDLGNTTHLVMVGLLIALWWFKQGKEWISGILLGFNGLIKIPLIIPSGYFFIRRRWRLVGGGLLVVGIMLGVSLLLVPFSLNHEWLDKCILSLSGYPVAAYNNQSISGFLARHLIIGSNAFSWIPIISEPEFNILSNILIALFYLPVVIMMLVNWKSSWTTSEYILEFLIVLVCSLLTSPISWTHYYMLLLIPVAFYLRENILEIGRLWLSLLFGCSMVFLSIPISLTLTLFEQTNQRIFLSLHFIGGIILYISLLALWYDKRYGFYKRNNDTHIANSK